MVYRMHFKGGGYKDYGDLNWLVFRLEQLPREVLAFVTRVEVRPADTQSEVCRLTALHSAS